MRPAWRRAPALVVATLPSPAPLLGAAPHLQLHQAHAARLGHRRQEVLLQRRVLHGQGRVLDGARTVGVPEHPRRQQQPHVSKRPTKPSLAGATNPLLDRPRSSSTTEQRQTNSCPAAPVHASALPLPAPTRPLSVSEVAHGAAPWCVCLPPPSPPPCPSPAHLSVLLVSSKSISLGLMQLMSTVRLLPPKESCRSLVSLLSR